jgi:signal transduction histidine kinase
MERPSLIATVFDAIRDPILVVDEGGSVRAANAAAMRLLDLEAAGDSLCRGRWKRLPVDLRQLAGLVAHGERAHGVPVVGRAGLDTGIVVDVEPLADTDGCRMMHFRARSDVVQRELWTDEAVASVAHELRNPLAAMKNALDVMASGAAGELSGDQRRFVDAVRRGTTRLSRMAEGYLDLSRARAGALSLARAPQDVHALVAELATDLVTLQPRLAGRLVCEVAPDVHAACIDRDRIAQVLQNLVANAARFTPGDRRVTVRVSRAGREVLDDELRLLPWSEIGEPVWVRIDVQDEGIGMGPDTLARIFEPYHAADRHGLADTGSAHLGMHIARTLVEAHDGWMTVESRLGEGTTVSVFVPENDDTAVRVSRVRLASSLVARLRGARRAATLVVMSVADWTSLRGAGEAWSRVAVVNPGCADLPAGRACVWVLSDRLAVAVVPGAVGAADAALLFSEIASRADDRAPRTLLSLGVCAVDAGASFAQLLGRALARMTNPTPPFGAGEDEAPVPVAARTRGPKDKE